MKTLDQIFRYNLDCSFKDDDWKKVLDYCKLNFGGGKIHKSTNPKSKSTYNQFIDWINNGFGSGDMVSYGKTMGIVGSSTPETTFLAAYCDFDGNLIVKDMVVQDVSRLKRLDDNRCKILSELIFKSGFDYDVRLSKICELYRPKEYSYVIIFNPSAKYNNVGMYLKSDGCKHYFLAFLEGNKLQTDCWIDSGCTPLKIAKEEDIKRLHKAASALNLYFNERVKQFVKLKKKKNNHYWYLNDRFEIISDIDNGNKKHTDRFNVGNYFLDYTTAVLFMKSVIELTKK